MPDGVRHYAAKQATMSATRQRSASRKENGPADLPVCRAVRMGLPQARADRNAAFSVGLGRITALHFSESAL
jgi:hypothetical protein